MKRICVYLGSNPGTNPAYGESAETLAKELAHRGLGTHEEFFEALTWNH
ncbi:hypothetical protein [Pseudodesulfovibrio sp. JC047]|nr:hypothetical protein [Pseudodesulfovibrio sp. JC047]